MIINKIYKTKNLLSLWLVSFLVGLRTYQQPCNCTNVSLHFYAFPAATVQATIVQKGGGVWLLLYCLLM